MERNGTDFAENHKHPNPVDGAYSVYHSPVRRQFVSLILMTESFVSIKEHFEHESDNVNEASKLSCLKSTTNQYWVSFILLVNQGMDVCNLYNKVNNVRCNSESELAV